MIKAFLTKYALVGAGALLVANIGQCVALKHYKSKSALCAAQCVADAQKARAEGESAVRAILEAAHSRERDELETRLRLEADANRRVTALAESEAREKIALQRRLNDALRNQDTRDWWDQPVPGGLLDAARGDDPAAGGDPRPDSLPPTPLIAPAPFLTTGIQYRDKWRSLRGVAG